MGIEFQRVKHRFLFGNTANLLRIANMKNIYVVTHTESIHHVEKKVGGWYDTGLTENGKHRAQRVATRLQEGFKVSKPTITSSDLLRAKETADVLASTLGSRVELDSRLREMSYGIAEGRSNRWLQERITIAPDDNRLHHRHIDGGETKAEFLARIYEAMDEIIAHENPNQIIVTHGFALTFVIARWIGMPAEAAGLVNFQGRSGGITHLQQDDYWRNRGVKLLNDLSHFHSPSVG